MGLEKRENLAVRKAETHSFEDVILWLCNTHRLRMKRLLELNFFVHNNYMTSGFRTANGNRYCAWTHKAT